MSSSDSRQAHLLHFGQVKMESKVPTYFSHTGQDTARRNTYDGLSTTHTTSRDPKRSPMMMMMMMRQLFRVSWMQEADCAICIFLTPTPLRLPVNLSSISSRKDGYDVIDHFIHLSFSFQHSSLKLLFIEAPSFPSGVKPVLQDRVGK